MRRGTAALADLVLAAVLAGTPAIGALAAGADDPAGGEAAIHAWQPAEDGEWTASEWTIMAENSYEGCSEGRYRTFSRTADGAMIELDYWDCAKVSAARTTTVALGERLGLVAAVDAPRTLRDGGQTVAHRPGWGGIYHVWSQEGFVLLAYRWCGLQDPVACRAAMGDEVTDAAAAIGLPVAPAANGVATPTDPLTVWQPTGGTWTAGEVTNPPVSDACETGGTGFTSDDGRVVVLTWARCPDQKDASLAEARYWAGSVLNTAGLGPAFGGLSDTYGTQTIDGVLRISRHWVQGEVYVGIETVCPGELAACADANLIDARSLATWLPGGIAEAGSASSLRSLGLLVAAIPLLTFLLVHVPRRLISRARTSGYRVPAPPVPEFEDVGPLVRRVKRGRTLRRVIVGVLVVAGYIALIMGSTNGPGGWVVFALVLFFGPFVLTALAILLLRILWRPHPLLRSGRMRARPGPAVVAGFLVRGLAILLAVAALEFYALATLFLVFDGLQGGEVVQGELERAAAGGDLLASLRLAFLFLGNTGLVALVFFAVLAVPIFAAYLLDRFGQRLTRSSLPDTLAADTRPYFLYLRGFDEDDLRVDESLGRRGFLELLAPFGRPRFEEVVVEHLTTAGPVIAISRGGSGLADLGAAKTTLADDEWRDRVREWVGGARAVVMSATPEEVRQGLLWEVEHLSGRADRPPIMLVVAPWPRDELARRWTGFQEYTREWSPFGDLAESGFPDGIHLATWTAARGWRAYGATRRWDWSYAAALRRALESGDL
ncbi:MAG: hypothetical protein KF727_00100 [Microbacteriaceae bacterium]|nr:hypothetical protein [Microbacteriaceae bacterium]